MFVKFKKLYQENGEVYLRVKVRPSAAKTYVKEVMVDETVKIDIAAPAVKGKANQELIKFLAKQLETVVGNIKIISGAGERIKLIKICQK